MFKMYLNIYFSNKVFKCIEIPATNTAEYLSKKREREEFININEISPSWRVEEEVYDINKNYPQMSTSLTLNRREINNIMTLAFPPQRRTSSRLEERRRLIEEAERRRNPTIPPISLNSLLFKDQLKNNCSVCLETPSPANRTFCPTCFNPVCNNPCIDRLILDPKLSNWCPICKDKSETTPQLMKNIFHQLEDKEEQQVPKEEL